MDSQDERWMRMALLEAEQAAEEGEVPVGAVVVCNGKIVGRGHNMTETLKDVTAHACLPTTSPRPSPMSPPTPR